MKHMKASKRITRLISLLLVLSLVISLFSVNAFADNNAIISQSSAELEGVYREYGKLINSLETSTSATAHEDKNYVEGEVLIGIADNATTRSMSFSSVYSDDYQAINQSEKARNLNKIAAEPVETITEQLNIDLDITEMTLLNPSGDKRSSDGKYQIDGKENSIYCLKLNGVTVEEAIEELSANPLISYLNS